MLKNDSSTFPVLPKLNVSSVLFKFTVTNDTVNHQIVTFEKLEAANVSHCDLKRC